MPTPTETQPRVERVGETLHFAGALSRTQVRDLWQRLPSLAGVQVLELSAVIAVDSAGLALLAEVTANLSGDARIVGNPAGLEALRSAYRLDQSLGFGD